MVIKNKAKVLTASSLMATVFISGLTSSAIADIKIGALYPLSGGLALLGEESYRGLQIAVDQVNSAGGIQGQEVVLRTGDAVDNNQAIGEARRLISQEKVDLIFGTFSSARAIAASQVSQLSQVPYIELGAVADDITDRGLGYVFRTNPSAYNFADTIVEMLVDFISPALGLSPSELRIGIIHED